MTTNGQQRSQNSSAEPPLGIAGRIAATFQASQITPLLALVAILLGLFAVMVTPREEEPQIDVTMANVIVPFPGASVADVEQMISVPAEQVLSQMQGVEHVMSVSSHGLAIITVQFKVGVKRETALVRLYDTVNSNADWLPASLGVMPAIIKPKGIDDVPIVTLTLYSTSDAIGLTTLKEVAQSMENELKRVPGTRQVSTVGGYTRQVRVDVDPVRMAAQNMSLLQLTQVLEATNVGMPIGNLLQNNQQVSLQVDGFIRNAADMKQLIVGTRNGKPVYLQSVADVYDGVEIADNYVWHGVGTAAVEGSIQSAEYPAVTLAITKKPGENAINVANAIMQRTQQLENTLIPPEINVVNSRNYGATANDKASKLIQKLLFATLSVVALVFLTLGYREAAMVGVAVLTTLTVTLFASWAWGFTLNRVSLFALIFSIGILVDDAIVVVENIHRHRLLEPHLPLLKIIPGAVDEVGGPTILATFTVIAALLPMAFVSGLMGPYMSPIPINASMGMLLSLAIAFVFTPWLARIWASKEAQHGTEETHASNASFLSRFFHRLFGWFLTSSKAGANRLLLALGVLALIGASVALPMVGAVVLKMLPFDNKSELQVIVDMPAGTTLEKTAAVLRELGSYLQQQPEVLHYQAYAGTASPINFNGLVRQYDMRQQSHQGDIQVNLLDKHDRHEQSHEIAVRLREPLQAIGKPFGASVKIVEVPPGPPVFAPIVAEVYGPDAKGREQLSRQLLEVFQQTENVVDADTSVTADQKQLLLAIDRRKANSLGVSNQAIANTLYIGMQGREVTYLRDSKKYPTPVVLQLPPQSQGDLDALLKLRVPSDRGQMIPIRELLLSSQEVRDQIQHHKDLLPVTYVYADMAPTRNSESDSPGKLQGLDSPLYGMFAMRKAVQQIVAPDGHPLEEYFISQPDDAFRGYSIKWDGEWQITYETFRDMGAAYGVGLILIYLLVVAQFGSYRTPLIIMAPIPLTVIGVMPGHALFGAQFTATSMIGMIALAGIIVRNSILLVDFINLQVDRGVRFEDAIINSAITRAKPIILTGLAAMMGAFFILDDPIFNGLAIALIFGILVSTLLTLLLIPLLYYITYRKGYVNKTHHCTTASVD